MLYQVSSGMGEVNIFYSSFSEADHYLPSFEKFEKPWLVLGLFSNQSYYLFVSIFWLYLKARVSLAHEILSFCKSILNLYLIKAQKANLSM